MMRKHFHIYGDNVVECTRMLNYVIHGLGDLVEEVKASYDSITCPLYSVVLPDQELLFRFFPGYGDHRWNQNVLSFVRDSGGKLREAADVIFTRKTAGDEQPIAAIEFCGALPAGNQAWQRQGRAFSFAHAGIPYFYVAELGGFELDEERRRKAERMPNPAVPFSFLSMTEYQGSACLPVYGFNAGATDETIKRYKSVFGTNDFHAFLKHAVLGESTACAEAELASKCAEIVKLLASSRKRQEGLTLEQWEIARRTVSTGGSLLNFLDLHARLSWRKSAYIESLTESARAFMGLCAERCYGLTSGSLPLSFVPAGQREAFSRKALALYSDAGPDFGAWLSDGARHLAISWVMGFKPAGGDARPDRGLPPFARMLIGEECDLMTFVYGPAPAAHWEELDHDPIALARRNGLWDSVLGASDSVLVDSSTKPSGVSRSYLRSAWAVAPGKERISLNVEPKVLSFGEQDVDTALHMAFESLGLAVAFEGMCNPPGGDWSGISFRWDSDGAEYRWLTLPRVSADGAKRPDHVAAIFGCGRSPVCLCVESKERARSLGSNIGPRLARYVGALFDTPPSVCREKASWAWRIYDAPWRRRRLSFLSAGAYLGTGDDPFKGVAQDAGLDVQIGVEFLNGGRNCILHLRGDTPEGRRLAKYLAKLRDWGEFVTVRLNS